MVAYVVGSRASSLARVQVSGYLSLLRARFPGVVVVRREISEGGDRDRTSPLSQVSERSGGSAFSSKQEEALVHGEVDFVVHSLKDVPISLAPGTLLLPPPGREDVRDALCGSTLSGGRAAHCQRCPGRLGSAVTGESGTPIVVDPRVPNSGIHHMMEGHRHP